MININSQDFVSGVFPVWRGFRHNRQYNHRTNRLGSFFEIKDNHHCLSHSGASGTGKDVLTYQDQYSLVKPDSGSYFTDKVELELKAQEGEIKSFSEKIKVKLNAKDKDVNFGYLLNGFDLTSITKSDKLHLLEIDIRELSKTKDFITFEVSGKLSLDCKSPECQINEKNFHYKLDIYYLLVRVSNFVYEKSSGSIFKSYPWKVKNKKELNLYQNGQNDHVLYLENPLNDYPVYAIGYRKIAVYIENRSKGKDATVHMLDLNLNIKNFRPVFSNQIEVSHEIFFRNWQKNMKKVNFHSSWTFRQKGYFKGEVKLGVLRFKKADIITTGVSEGQIKWSGNNADPGKASIKTKKLLKIDSKKLLY